jgi:hypothetical protein
MIYKDLKDYFKQIADEHVDIKSFVQGDASDLRKQILSVSEYPLLWFGMPMLNISTVGGNVWGKSKDDFVVLVNAPDQHTTKEERDNLWTLTEQICLDIISRLIKDRKEKKHSINLDIMDLVPVDPLLVDGVIGWRVEFEIGQRVDICYDQDKWNNA